MIGHVQTPEQDPIAKREVCSACRKVALPHEHTDQGPICRSCTNRASVIRLEYVIDGRIFTKDLKAVRVLKGGKR